MDHIIAKYKAKQTKTADASKKPAAEPTIEFGLETIAKHMNTLSRGRLDLQDIRAPQKKLYVMILGNHSAGKSSFINWYVGEKLQSTRVSIETIEINLIMHGRSKTELSGHNVIKLLPFMAELYDYKTE